MKRTPRILSGLVAVFVILALLSGVFLSFEHDCAHHDGCTVCALISTLEQLLEALGLCLIWKGSFSIFSSRGMRRRSIPCPTAGGASTLVALKVKLSN